MEALCKHCADILVTSSNGGRKILQYSQLFSKRILEISTHSL